MLNQVHSQTRYYIDETIDLFDEKATADGIRELFTGLAERLGPGDSLFIYYAGHGQVDASGTGYLIPVDGGRNQVNRENWLPNRELRDYLSGLKARSVMLAADACFSGDMLNLTRGTAPEPNVEYFRKSLRFRARQVLTSGALESVPDESEFTRQFLNMLERNTETYLDPITMFDTIRRGVTRTMPLMGNLLRNGGFIVGGAGAVSAVIFYLLGDAAMKDYRAATTSSAAGSARSNADMYTTFFNKSLSAAGLGLATGGISWLLAPDVESIGRDLDAKIRKLADLRTDRRPPCNRLPPEAGLLEKRN